MSNYHGHCLCGGVRFRIQGPLAPIQVCHCSQCRRAQGTAVATNVPVDDSAFTLEQGSEWLTAFESSPGKRRVFCRVCGSPVYSERDGLPGVKRIRIGLITEPIDAPLQAHYFVGSKANWWPICEGGEQDAVARFEAGPESAPMSSAATPHGAASSP